MGREIEDYHQSLTKRCEEHGISVTMYKTIKGLVNLAAISLAAFAMYEGLEPYLAVVFAMMIIQGPEVLEYIHLHGERTEDGE